MPRSLFCRCGAVYDAEKLEEGKLYKCRECESLLSVENAVDEEELAVRQKEAIPKSGALISAVLILALALLGFAVAAFQVKAKADDARTKYENKVKSYEPLLKEWEARAKAIRIVDESEKRASSYMKKVFDYITRARKKVYPAVVRIFCTTTTGMAGTGSGCIFQPDGHEGRKDGYIVTNFHVVQNADILEVTLSNQETVLADCIYADDFCDVAVIKLKDPAKAENITPARFGDSDKIRVGDYCMAMGAPQGLGRSISLGIICGVNRYIVMPLGMHISHREHVFFQMDSAINHGNSGGPLVSLRGEIIGMNTLGWVQFQRVGYAIASNYEREIANEIVRNHEAGDQPFVDRSTFGLRFMLQKDLGIDWKTGAPVASVASDSPAYDAGIRPGDVIVRVRNTKTNEVFEPTAKELGDLARVNYIFEKNEVMTEFEVTWKDYITGEEKTATMTSQGMPPREEPRLTQAEDLWGAKLEVCTATDLEVAGFGDEDEGGFVIRSWAPGTKRLTYLPVALRSVGLQRGDIIRYVDGVKPQSHWDMYRTIVSHVRRDQARRTSTPVIFEVIRGKTKLYIPIMFQ